MQPRPSSSIQPLMLRLRGFTSEGKRQQETKRTPYRASGPKIAVGSQKSSKEKKTMGSVYNVNLMKPCHGKT